MLTMMREEFSLGTHLSLTTLTHLATNLSDVCVCLLALNGSPGIGVFSTTCSCFSWGGALEHTWSD